MVAQIVSVGCGMRSKLGRFQDAIPDHGKLGTIDYEYKWLRRPIMFLSPTKQQGVEKRQQRKQSAMELSPAASKSPGSTPGTAKQGRGRPRLSDAEKLLNQSLREEALANLGPKNLGQGMGQRSQRQDLSATETLKLRNQLIHNAAKKCPGQTAAKFGEENAKHFSIPVEQLKQKLTDAELTKVERFLKTKKAAGYASTWKRFRTVNTGKRIPRSDREDLFHRSTWDTDILKHVKKWARANLQMSYRYELQYTGESLPPSPARPHVHPERMKSPHVPELRGDIRIGLK